MLKNIFLTLFALTFLSACSTWEGSSKEEKAHHFISYNSSNDDLHSSPSRLPSSTPEKKEMLCEKAHATNFVSYSNDKEYYYSSTGETMVCDK